MEQVERPRGVLLLDFLRPGINGSVEDYIPEEVQEYAAYLFEKSGRRRPSLGTST